MKIGYACLTIGVNDTDFKTVTKKYLNEDHLRMIIAHNLDVLKRIIKYNYKNKIRLYRISSDIIPFGSSDLNTLDWANEFKEQLNEIGQLINKYQMRVSMHPGQYTVLNSNNEEVVERAIDDLRYHCLFLDSLNVDSTHKLILHVGGIYNDKPEAIKRFCLNYQRLDQSIKNRLVIENDDKSYTLKDCLYISSQINIPVIFDNLHHEINHSLAHLNQRQCLELVLKTWQEKDGTCKTHYSQQNPAKKTGSHSITIVLNQFLEYLEKFKGLDFDIMLEVKDKNLSATKCSNTVFYSNNHIILEREWAKYKYSILEKSENNYLKIRQLLKDQNCSFVEFYTIIEQTLILEEDTGQAINAIQHVWGYFKKQATQSEKNMYLKLVEQYLKQEIKLSKVKNYLNKLNNKYQDTYLANCLYFEI